MTLEIAQGAIEDVQRDLEAIPGLLEAHATTGSGDVLCRVAAASHEALQQVLVDLNRSPRRRPFHQRGRAVARWCRGARCRCCESAAAPGRRPGAARAGTLTHVNSHIRPSPLTGRDGTVISEGPTGGPTRPGGQMTDPKTWKRAAGAAGLVATGLVAGGILAGTLSANAADTAHDDRRRTARPARPVDPSQPQRSDEQLLTGDTKAHGGEGGAGEVRRRDDRAHRDRLRRGLRVAHRHRDGQHVIVQVDKDFAVTGTQTGGPGGTAAPDATPTTADRRDSGGA